MSDSPSSQHIFCCPLEHPSTRSPRSRASRLVSLSNPPSDAPSLEVRWGRAPGRESTGEASAAEKVAGLQQYVSQNGRLDRLPPTTIIDLRPAAGTSVVDEKTSLQPLK